MVKDNVIQAIKQRRLLKIRYGKRRNLTVAPQILGRTMTGYTALLCYQDGLLAEDETCWRLLDLNKVNEVEVLNTHFGPPPGRRLPSGEFDTIDAVI